MIKIYEATTTDFVDTEIADIEVLKAITKKKVNGLYSLSFTVPIHYASEIVQDRIVEADGDYYRILKVKKKGKDKEVFEVYAESIVMLDLLDDYVESFIYSDLSVQAMLSLLLADTNFTVGTCSDLGNGELAVLNSSKLKILKEILICYQGELKINGTEVTIVSAIGQNNQVVFKRGKNLKGIEATEDISNVITKLEYASKSGLYRGSVESSNIGKYSREKVAYQEFDALSQLELNTLALAYLEENDEPMVNYKVDYAELYYTEEYQAVKDLEKTELGDSVTIQHETFGIDITARIIEYERDIATHKNTKVVLGNFGTTFFDFQVALNDVKDTVEYAFEQRKLNAATLKGLKIVDEVNEEVTFEVTEEGNVKIQGDAVIGGTLDANKVNIINFKADTGDVYYISADNAKVRKLTVSEVLTMLVEEGKEEYHFIHIHDEQQEWKSAYRKYYDSGEPYPDEPLINQEGQQLYWSNNDHNSMTTLEQDMDGNAHEAIYVHPYVFKTKLEIGFNDLLLENGTQTKAPVMWWGSGTGNSNNGRSRLYKDQDGFSMTYYSGINGDKRQIDMNDSGIDFLIENGTISGITDSMLVHKNDKAFILESGFNQVDGYSLKLSSDSHLKFSMILTVEATMNNSIQVQLALNADILKIFTFQVHPGMNTLQLLYPILTVPVGEHDILIDLKDENGSTRVDPEDCITMIEGKNIEGGIAPMYPKANVVDNINLSDVVLVSDAAFLKGKEPVKNNGEEILDFDTLGNMQDKIEVGE